MKIIGIDPGYERLGVAIIKKKEHGGKETLIQSGCIITKRDQTHASRLKTLGDELCLLLEEHCPDALAIEKLFFNTNQKTAIMVAEARGVIIYEAAKRGIPIFEYTPQEIKIAVTGYGKSTKDGVMRMIPKLVSLQEDKKRHDDEYDAIAVALTCSATGAGVRKY